MEKLRIFFENWDFEYMDPLKILLLDIIILFTGFGLLKLSHIIGGWWLIIPAWIGIGGFILGFTLFTIHRFINN